MNDKEKQLYQAAKATFNSWPKWKQEAALNFMNAYKEELDESGDFTKRLTKREGKHTIRIGNEWRRDDPVWEKLAEYEDVEEQGLFLMLPCKIGDTVWNISWSKVYEAKVVCIRPFVFEDYVEYRGNAVITMKDPFYSDGRPLEQEVFIVFGKDTFFTKEEADEALSEKIKF